MENYLIVKENDKPHTRFSREIKFVCNKGGKLTQLPWWCG